MSGLSDPAVRAVLERLHAQATAQQPRWPGLGLGLGLRRRLRRRWQGTPQMEAVAERTRSLCLSVSPEQGRLLYVLARLMGARRVVEFGTSFGVSAVYLAAAIRDNGGGRLTGTEWVPEKRAAAEANLRAAGLGGVSEVLGGAALEALVEGAEEEIDLIFLDGHKEEYLRVWQLLAPRLRVGGVVIADNLLTFPRELLAYRRLLSENHSFVTVLVPLGGGMLVSVRVAE